MLKPSTLPPINLPYQPTSGNPLSGTFVNHSPEEEDQGNDDDALAVLNHSVEEWSDDEKHVQPIRDNTLYYNDVLHALFKEKHKDGRVPHHKGICV